MNGEHWLRIHKARGYVKIFDIFFQKTENGSSAKGGRAGGRPPPKLRLTRYKKDTSRLSLSSVCLSRQVVSVQLSRRLNEI